jgi:pimeloyl-ACP methyl ester carboxylesterase
MDSGPGKLGDVIAVHGCPGSVFDFRYVAGELERGGLRVIRLDMPGNTRTPLDATDGLGDAADGKVLAALVIEVAQQLNLRQPLLLAHSVGAQVVQNAAETAPDDRFLGLALINPAPLLVPHRMIRPYWLVRAVCYFSTVVDSLPVLRVGFRFFLRKIVVLWGFTPKISEEECAYIMRRLLMVDWWRQRERAARLRQRRIPTLVAYTKDDPMIEEHLSHELSQALPSGPRLVFPDGGHFANKWHAESIAAAVLDFVGLAHMNRQASSTSERSADTIQA